MAVTGRLRRAGLTREGGTPLLRTVSGKPHARVEDHEDVLQKEHKPQELQEDFNAPPVDSDDEALRVPPPKTTKSPLESLKSLLPSSKDEDGLRKPPKRKAGSKLPPHNPEPELRKPGPAKKARNAAPIVPRSGSFKQNQAAKVGIEGNKENSCGTHTPPASSGDIWRERFGLFSSQSSQTAPKKTYGGGNKARNIHVAPPSAKKQDRKPILYAVKAKNEVVQPEQHESESECSMLGDDDIKQMDADLTAIEAEQRKMEELGLRNVPGRKKKPVESNGNTDEASAMDEAELDATLGKPTLHEQLGLTGRQEGSLPPSSAPQEDMDSIDDYVRELPAQAEEGTACPVCNEPVDQDLYWLFWKGLDKTIKNQAAFCHTHRKATAQKEYLAEGYPSVDGLPSIQWSAIPERIKKHRMALYSILAGETPSHHRKRYAPLALTGKAAAVPRTRTDLSPSKNAQLSAYALDSNSVYPGYYGPRGRRLITEAVMSLLNAEIKRSADPVVQTSGPATFVQAVLVPEVAVRLIMEDLRCDVESAEEVREATFEMGALLHEEVEDRVELAGGEEDEENEYHG
ncbi:uncharacterized protein M421DRAFT_287424 [Didymella exigua CBS 183.55]|uniref:Restriction of telomere capping protein 4 n=1 Tax=Didymella exigua CBS 183.55 TaxID=1150837 RepID=A0A6A5RUV1_9PLEO|nr:uncharacterized protein M421DRAFT_287424 [Didymella exigua CBS 183.55]KAF1932245.1 hypothetical protein M421DRAFT_287424 [Didymella exigua CBS 183.55]